MATTPMPPHLEQDLVGVVLQFLDEQGYREAARQLALEARYHFDLDHFRALFVDGRWAELGAFVRAFFSADRSAEHSLLVFEILKHKFLDSLDRGDKEEATAVLKGEILPFLSLDETAMDPLSKRAQIYNELAALLTFDDFRGHLSLHWAESARETRRQILPNIEVFLTEKIPSVAARFEMPEIPEKSRLRTIVNQSLKWQREGKKDDDGQFSVDEIRTLFVDQNNQSGPETPHGNLAFSQKAKPPEVLDDDGYAAAMAKLEAEKAKERDIERARMRERDAAFASTSNGSSFHAPVRGRLRPPETRDMSSSNGASRKRPRVEEEMDVMDVSIPFHRPCQQYSELGLPYAPTLVSFHPKVNELLLVGGKTGELSLINPRTGGSFSTLNLEDRISGALKLICWSQDCTLVAVASASPKAICLVGVEASSETNSIALRNTIALNSSSTITTIHLGVIPSAIRSSEGKPVVFVGFEDALIFCLDVHTGEHLYTFKAHTAAVTTLCLVKFRSVPILVSTAKDGTMRAWLIPAPSPNSSSMPLTPSSPSKPSPLPANASSVYHVTNFFGSDAVSSAVSPAIFGTAPSYPAVPAVKAPFGKPSSPPTSTAAPPAPPRHEPVLVTENQPFTSASECRSMVYYRERLFSCGADAESFLEWNYKNGNIKAKFASFPDNARAMIDQPSSGKIFVCADNRILFYDFLTTKYLGDFSVAEELLGIAASAMADILVTLTRCAHNDGNEPETKVRILLSKQLMYKWRPNGLIEAVQDAMDVDAPTPRNTDSFNNSPQSKSFKTEDEVAEKVAAAPLLSPSTPVAPNGESRTSSTVVNTAS